MITLYTYPTPNGHKASILFEELGLSYTAHSMDLANGEQHTEAYLDISPLGKLPAVVETLADGRIRRIFGSGAILQHYAEQEGRLIPADADGRLACLNWLAFGISDLGPTGLDLFRFNVMAPEKLPYAIDLFVRELRRCHQAMERRLATEEFLAGNSYSIADIACFPFINAAAQRQDTVLADRPGLRRWFETVAARPAVVRGMRIPAPSE